VNNSIGSVFEFNEIENLFNVLNYVEQDDNSFFLKKNPKEKYLNLISLFGVEKEINQLEKLQVFLRKLKKLESSYSQEIRSIQRKNQNLITPSEKIEFENLLSEVNRYWDNEKIKELNYEQFESSLNELEKINFLLEN